MGMGPAGRAARWRLSADGLEGAATAKAPLEVQDRDIAGTSGMPRGGTKPFGRVPERGAAQRYRWTCDRILSRILPKVSDSWLPSAALNTWALSVAQPLSAALVTWYCT